MPVMSGITPTHPGLFGLRCDRHGGGSRIERRTEVFATPVAEQPVLDIVSGTPVSKTAAELAARIAGRVATPADPDWDQVRMAWNVAVDQRPEIVVLPEIIDDVVATVELAGSAGMRVAPQGTGHNAGSLGQLTGTVLLRTDRMREVAVDVDARRVRVAAGVLWGEVTTALAPHGLAALAGSSPDVGVAGYLLGGGFSWLAREYGLGASSITAIEVVTGDGVFHRVDADHEPELFWAVRGGAGNLGVVCAIEMAVYDIPQVYGGAMLFPIEQAARVFGVYEEWTRGLDERATTCIRLLRVPTVPDVPEPLRGRAFVVVDGAIDAPAAEAEALLAPLRAIGPEIDMFGIMPTAALGQIHMDPPGPSPARGDGLILTDMTAQTIDALLSIAGPGAETPLLAVDIRHLGGAVGRRDPRGGVVDHLPGRFLVFGVGITPFPEAVIAVEHAVEQLRATLAPWTADRDYTNFREVSAPATRFYDEVTLGRLRRIREVHDPRNVVRSNHSWSD
jgi:hypothetical protein